MKKMALKMWLLGGIAAFSLCATSCSHGADCDDTFSGGVTNTQLEAPSVEGFVISSQTNSDGSESLVVEWPVVYGAGGYLVTVAIVDDPANPQYLPIEGQAQSGEGENVFIDGCRIVFEKREDTNYEVRVKAAANEKLNNTESAEPAVFAYSTLLPAEKIPHAEYPDIAVFINNYLATNAETLKANHEADCNFEIAFELEAGKEYTINEPIDFGLISTTIRTDSKTNNAKVVFGENGRLIIQAGMKIKFVDFDATKLGKAFFYLSDTPDESIKDANLKYKGGNSTYKQLGASKNAYIVEDPITFQNGMIKNLANGFIYAGKGYGLMDVRITNSIVQLNGKTQFIRMQSGNTHIKDLTFRESTIFNAVSGSFYFIALNNQNRPKVFGSAAATSSWRFEQFTLYLPGNGNRCDRLKADGGHTNYFTDAIIFNLRQIDRIYGNYDINNTTIYNNVNVGDSKNYDSDYAKEGVEPVDPGFVGPIGELDLSKPNGGVNLKPTSAPCVDGKRGDPRWF